MPLNGSKREKWVEEIEKRQPAKSDLPTYICNEHFTEQDFIKSGSKSILIPDAVPTVFKPNKRRRIEGVSCDDCMKWRNKYFKAEKKIKKLKEQVTSSVSQLNGAMEKLNKLEQKMHQTYISTVIISFYKHNEIYGYTYLNMVLKKIRLTNKI